MILMLLEWTPKLYVGLWCGIEFVVGTQLVLREVGIGPDPTLFLEPLLSGDLFERVYDVTRAHPCPGSADLSIF